jgi:hypothetical protein
VTSLCSQELPRALSLVQLLHFLHALHFFGRSVCCYFELEIYLQTYLLGRHRTRCVVHSSMSMDPKTHKVPYICVVVQNYMCRNPCIVRFPSVRYSTADLIILRMKTKALPEIGYGVSGIDAQYDLCWIRKMDGMSSDLWRIESGPVVHLARCSFVVSFCWL